MSWAYVPGIDTSSPDGRVCAASTVPEAWRASEAVEAGTLVRRPDFAEGAGDDARCDNPARGVATPEVGGEPFGELVGELLAGRAPLSACVSVGEARRSSSIDEWAGDMAVMVGLDQFDMRSE
ncbi:hypothetical protein DIE06_21705 [Burkholderia sp. Bp8998]|nr:hypothetical protein DIE06_21705 [Burkholderia sp. Bp8998]